MFTRTNQTERSGRQFVINVINATSASRVGEVRKKEADINGITGISNSGSKLV